MKVDIRYQTYIKYYRKGLIWGIRLILNNQLDILCYILITIVSNRSVNDGEDSITYMWRLIWDTRLISNIITMGWYEVLRLISNTKLDSSGAVHGYIYNDLRVGRYIDMTPSMMIHSVIWLSYKYRGSVNVMSWR